MNLKEEYLLNDRYKLSKRIGSGGFSVVWLAEDVTNKDKEYAIKIYAPQQGLNPDDIKMFELEYKRLSELSHPNIIETNGYFLLEESPCLVLKFCSKGSLHQLIKSGKRLSEIDIANLMVDIGGALHYLHTLPTPIYHLDLKPENILIDNAENREDSYVLTDFGISNEVRSTLLRRSSVVAETFSYRSPERALNHNLSEKHDIFSFGIVLMECCRGFFDAKFSIADSVLNGYDLPKIEGYSSRLIHIFNLIIQLDPDDRPSALYIYNFGKHFIENGYWPKVETERKTRRSNILNNVNPYVDKSYHEEGKQEKWHVPAIVLVGILTLIVMTYGIYEISNTKTTNSEIDKCQEMLTNVNDLFIRGRFSSIENLSSHIVSLCPNNLDLNNKVDSAKTCLSLLKIGNNMYDKKEYESAQRQYEYFKNCKCPDDSAGIVKARLDIIPKKLSKDPLIKKSLQKIDEATKSPN